ncbi:hypothetical protein KO528_11050 [Saccharophagus degradans]|uniref:hypothetical protein n=1 Tax=Saccharophagus degradans TaxID=86304 RepID=UPI001C09D936|nr:hypothetical protein [Saccharophagus degradans]MBU2985890.1 hypothetical protein [Saccharophagus degradans]
MLTNTDIYTSSETSDFLQPTATQYRFLDGATASGKSSAVCSHIRKFIGYRNQIIVCEKVELLEEWRTKLQAKGIKCDLIAGDGAVKDVDHWFNTHNTYISTGVLLCTQAAIMSVGRVSMKHECDVFFDELPPVRNVIADKFHTCASVIKEQLKLGSVVKRFTTEFIDDDGRRKRNQPDSLRKVSPSDRKDLKKYLKSSSNIITDSQKDLFSAVLSQNHEVYVKELAFQRLGMVKANSDDREHRGETTFVVMTNDHVFKGWGSCTVISSDYELSMFKHCIGNRLGFKRHEFLHCRLNNRGQHPDTWLERTKFNYLIHPDEKAGLNSLFWLEHERGRNSIELDKRLKRVIGSDEQVLLCTNVSRSKRRFAKQPNVTVITSKDIGVNEYSDRTTVVFDAALNERCESESILKLLGIDLNTIRLDGIFNVAYQVVSRGNLRTNRAGESVNLYFSDKFTCDYVMTRFANRAGQVANVRHVGDNSYQPVNVVPILGNVEYSNRLKSRLRRRIKRFGGGKDGFLHQLKQSTLEPREARPRRQVTTLAAGIEGATGATLGDTSSLVESEIDSTLCKSGTYGEMVSFHGGINIESPPKLTISDLPTKSDWLAYRQFDEFGVQKLQKSKLRQFINGVLKNQISQAVSPIIQGERFFYSNFAIFEFSANQCSKDEFIKTFSPLYSDNKNRRVSFLISEDGGTIQVMVFFKSPCASWARYKQKLATIESGLGFGLDVDQNRHYRLQEGFEIFNCGRSRDLQRHAL